MSTIYWPMGWNTPFIPANMSYTHGCQGHACRGYGIRVYEEVRNGVLRENGLVYLELKDNTGRHYEGIYGGTFEIQSIRRYGSEDCSSERQYQIAIKPVGVTVFHVRPSRYDTLPEKVFYVRGCTYE